MLEIKVGSPCVLVANGANSGRYNARKGIPPNYFHGVITKVGRKYFTVKTDRWELEFHIDGLWQKGDYCATHSVHENWEDYLEKLEVSKLNKELKDKYFSQYTSTKLSRCQVERITAILEENNT